MEAIEVILDILDKLIIDKAFNKKYNLKKRLIYIFIYYIVIVFLFGITVFVGVSYLKSSNIVEYFILLISIIMFILLLFPFLRRNQ